MDNSALESLLGRVLDQVKYAEAKNGVLATLAVACGVATMTAFSIRSSGGLVSQAYLVLVPSIIFFVAGGVSIISFLPRRDNAVSGGPVSDSDNLYYFEHLARLNEDALVKAFHPDVEVGSKDWTNRVYVANQIIANSRIASKKYDVFRIGGVTFLIGISALIVVLVTEVAIAYSKSGLTFSPVGSDVRAVTPKTEKGK